MLLPPQSIPFSAPSQPGPYPVVVTDTLSNASIRLQVFVLHPWDHEGEWLNGVRIGNYEMTPRNGRAVYEPPEGLIEVTAKNKDAADVFVDADRDQWMDDLTDDGRATRTDARHLADIERRIPTPGDNQFQGGLSVYGATSQRGPFVHLDLRGRWVRW